MLKLTLNRKFLNSSQGVIAYGPMGFGIHVIKE